MKTFQSRVLEQIEALITKFGLETSQQADWGNTGNICIHQPGSVFPVALIGYNFQSASYKLTLTVGERRVPSQLGRYDYYDFYHDGLQSKTRFWGCLCEELSVLKGNVLTRRVK